MKDIFENTYWYMCGFDIAKNHLDTYNRNMLDEMKITNKIFSQGYSDFFEMFEF